MKNWDDVPKTLREIAERVCTSNELLVLKLRARRWKDEQIATALQMERDDLAALLRAATKKIREEVIALRGIRAR